MPLLWSWQFYWKYPQKYSTKACTWYNLLIHLRCWCFQELILKAKIALARTLEDHVATHFKAVWTTHMWVNLSFVIALGLHVQTFLVACTWIQLHIVICIPLDIFQGTMHSSRCDGSLYSLLLLVSIFIEKVRSYYIDWWVFSRPNINVDFLSCRNILQATMYACSWQVCCSMYDIRWKVALMACNLKTTLLQ